MLYVVISGYWNGPRRASRPKYEAHLQLYQRRTLLDPDTVDNIWTIHRPSTSALLSRTRVLIILFV